MIICNVATVQVVSAWGVRGHQAINGAAVRALPKDGVGFLKDHEQWVVYLSNLPDSWRRSTEPALKILEDPNHGWFKEQFDSLETIPRSRYEFVIALYEQYKKEKATNPEAAALTNVRWTGTLPYAAQENFERMKAAMRRLRAMAADAPERKMCELEIATYMGRLGHYTGDGAQPLHDTIHHDGWVGDNPNGYTRETRVHGRFESQFVDLIQASADDLASRISAPKHLDDPFVAILDHLNLAASHVEEVYQLDKAGAFADKSNAKARDLALERLASGAQLLRDLAYTAWIDSAADGAGIPNPVDRSHPEYNPETGSAPPGAPVRNRK
jgi:hypothetical protein